MRDSHLAGLRRPEHTGENRCWPCTAVNVAILAALSAAVFPISAVLSALVGAVGLLLVGLRGYLIPGTPRFAPRIVSRLPGGDALFHGSEAPAASGTLSADGGASGDSGASSDSGASGGDEAVAEETDARTDTAGGPAGSGGVESADGDDLLDRLVAAGVLAADGDTIAPTGAFEERWHAEMEELRGLETEALADAALEVSPATIAHAVTQDGEEWVALAPHADANAVEETWLSRPVAVAEIGGARAAAAFVDDDATALAAAQTCRMFLDACPECGTELERGNEMDCCGGHTGPTDVPRETLVCPSCEVRLYTFE
ncbi:hypothetical protein [Halobellus limi]|uniref:Uncharacterized protein n=1 Tax=Halobellus limi TaxID=699433 RepID=A0A1H6C3T7_9EURY|nr:hypothetical protein [Halobellus limi]QCC48594.1 hypothetical protein DV707_13515 [Halobellus limi]SEG67598.1 hypothetical protein SAMN04488133_3192 [Halobellus limi]